MTKLSIHPKWYRSDAPWVIRNRERRAAARSGRIKRTWKLTQEALDYIASSDDFAEDLVERFSISLKYARALCRTLRGPSGHEVQCSASQGMVGKTPREE